LVLWLNASFGVLMEGPVLGIPFWFFLGFATGRSLGPDGVESEEDRLSSFGFGLSEQHSGKENCQS
jgi:hypothetical protein